MLNGTGKKLRAREREVDDLFVDLASLFPHAAVRHAAGNGDAGPLDVERVIPAQARANVDNLVAIYELALDVARHDSVPAMLRRLVDGAREAFGAISAAVMLDSPDMPHAVILLSGRPPAGNVRGWRTDTVRPVTGGDIPDHPMLLPDPFGNADAESSIEDHLSVATMMGVPLTVDSTSGAPTAGYLTLFDRHDEAPFSDAELALLLTLGRHAATAIGRVLAESGLATGQRRVEAELSQLRMIMDTLPAGILVMLPPDGRVELANETALTTILGDGATPEASLSIYRDFDWLRADGAELTRGEHPGMLALRGETIGNRALLLQIRDGRRIPVRVQSTPIHNDDGSVARAVVLFLDVSRERVAEQVKDDFLSLISHEFRTPLTAIHGGALLLSQQGDVMDAEMRHELLHDIGEESLRLDRMLGNLLSVSEIMAGRFQASTEPILVAPLIQPLLEEFRESAPGHRFTLDVEPATPPAEGSPELLMQILRNLYENAVKYSPAPADIRTVISQRGGVVSIEVIDNGLGIAAEHVPHVFERFRRPGADPTVRGMGLGLYLSRLLVDAQGGHIRAYSEGPGKGATFRVELPMVPDWEQEHDPDGGDQRE
jgi:signal transduction histidine kinase